MTVRVDNLCVAQAGANLGLWQPPRDLGRINQANAAAIILLIGNGNTRRHESI